MKPTWINTLIDAQVRSDELELDRIQTIALIQFLTTVQATEEMMSRILADPEVRTFQVLRIVRANLNRLANILDKVPAIERVYGEKFNQIQTLVGKALVTSPFELTGIQTLAEDFRELRRLVERPGVETR